MSHYLILNRDKYSSDSTIGKIGVLEEERPFYDFCNTLEDTVRAYGIKVKGATAIPSTEEGKEYFVDIRVSPRFGEVVVFYTSKEKREDGEYKYILENGGIRFEYILAHGGNKPEDTDGCVLVAKNRNESNMTIQGSYKKKIVALVKELQKTCDVKLRVINNPQLN